MNQPPQQFGERFVRLIEILSRCSDVAKYDKPGETQAETLAHALLDLEGSFRRFIDTRLPALIRNELSEQQVCDHLQEICDDFRHILYHMDDPQFLRDRCE